MYISELFAIVFKDDINDNNEDIINLLNSLKCSNHNGLVENFFKAVDNKYSNHFINLKLSSHYNIAIYNDGMSWYLSLHRLKSTYPDDDGVIKIRESILGKGKTVNDAIIKGLKVILYKFIDKITDDCDKMLLTTLIYQLVYDVKIDKYGRYGELLSNGVKVEKILFDKLVTNFPKFSSLVSRKQHKEIIKNIVTTLKGREKCQ